MECENDRFELDSKILEAKEGQNLMIRCAVEEATSIDHNMVWMEVNKDVMHSLPSRHDMREGRNIKNDYIYIQIDHARSVHAGNYSCMSKHNPKLSRNFTLQVKGTDTLINTLVL